ncbi:BamA/TamA family outer membrane protein [Spirulina subsalsa]|uniref:BamA/TamA family outer membrane protein n=1 Tax=Spirulina subsalsa TaxID=54311 RepID=UPI0002DA5285|nr:BamA/TamA family outer membrane protein [Spirulina subsalsa]
MRYSLIALSTLTLFNIGIVAPLAAQTSPTSAPSLMASNDLAVLTTDVKVVGVDTQLSNIALQTVRTRMGGNTSATQLQGDIQALLSTGLFSSARYGTRENANGVDVVFEVQPVIVRSLVLNNAQILPQSVVHEAFATQLGQPISPALIDQGIANLQKWYEENGYAIAQVADVRSVGDGVLNVDVAEGVIRSVQVRFIDDMGQVTDGRTNEQFIKQQLALQPGGVFTTEQARQDLTQLYRLGLFKTANIDLAGDARQLDVIYQLSEQSTRGVNAGGGYSESSGLFGTVSYNDRNIGGIGQNLDLMVQLGQRDLQFDATFGSPYRLSDPNVPGYSINAFRNRTISNSFGEDVALANGDRPREGRLGGGVTFTRPIDDWNANVGINFNQVTIRDSSGNLSPTDQFGNALSVSDRGMDDLVTLRAGLSQDRRDNPINPTSGSILGFSSEQSLPVGNGSILMNRLQANFSNYTPVSLFGGENPEVLAFNVQAGTTIGDLPPYEAFRLGGTNSVRGYNTGELGGSRSFVLASAEYRIPLGTLPATGVVFADFGSDLGSTSPTVGADGVTTNRGVGFGYGAGLRVNSPVGILRADFGLNDQGESRFHFGVGHRF